MKEEIDRLKNDQKLLEDPETIYSFGMMSFDGDSVPQDYVKAANWFRIAAEQGHAKAQHNLALMYENGQGMSQNYAEAAKWYHMAAEQGLASSQNNLGSMYENGDGVTQDHAEAIKWYRSAAANGDKNAPSNLNRLEERTDRDKYQGIWFAFTELMVAENIPLIGDCSILPHPKKTILYAIRWLMDYYETEQETTTDHTLREAIDKMLPKFNDIFLRLARDWQEIDPEDKDAIAKLGGCESFPDWALPLKLKYIDEEKASNEVIDVLIEVSKDRVATKCFNPSDPEYGRNNKRVTREEYEAAIKELRALGFSGEQV